MGIAVQVDHTVPQQVEALFARVGREQGGRLDVLVNDVWGGDEPRRQSGVLGTCGVSGEGPADAGAGGVVPHHHQPLRCALMVARGQGLVIEVTDGKGYGYREVDIFYSLAKVSAIHLADSMTRDLREHKVEGVVALAVTPGYLRSEVMLEGFGVTEANWRDGIKKDPDFAFSETPYYLGRGGIAGGRSAGGEQGGEGVRLLGPGAGVRLHGPGRDAAALPGAEADRVGGAGPWITVRVL